MKPTTVREGAPAIGTKRCAKCDEERPVEAFRAHRHTADGREHRCSLCRPQRAQRTLTPDERFDEKHEPRDAGHATPCWIWTGALNRHGYGSFRPGGIATCVGSHIWSFRRAGRVIPEGHELDHLCRNRACVNPAHLEAVTSRVNSLRGATTAAENAAKTHCANGHPFDESNTFRERNGNGRVCRICRTETKRRWNARAKLARAMRTHCPKGHALTVDNLMGKRPGGGCLTCHREKCKKLRKPANPAR